jgi:lysine 6-dehydrogenase
MKILVIGAGRMGRGAVYDLLFNSADVETVTVADADLSAAQEIKNSFAPRSCTARQFDAADFASAVELMRGHDAVISCVPYRFNFQLAQAALQARVNFCDLGGNNDVVAQELSLDAAAKAANINIIPDCGLAPGMVSLLAMHGARRFDRLESIKIRVGGLPQRPQPPLDYQLIFSVEGLINEYVEPSRIVRNGRLKTVQSLTEVEQFEFPGFGLVEAFHTSGGISTLPETFAGKVRELDYKTIRYKGHCEKFKLLLDLGMAADEEICFHDGERKFQIAPRRLLSELLKKNLPHDEPDVVLIRIEFVGTRNKRQDSLHYHVVDRFDAASGMSAMMRTTAFPASIIAQMLARGDSLRKGATPQEIAVCPNKFVTELARRQIQIDEQ